MGTLAVCEDGAGGDRIDAREDCRKLAKGAVEPSPSSPSTATEVLDSESSPLEDDWGSCEALCPRP